MQKYFIILILFFTVGILLSQESSLYIPTNVQKSYKNNTRSFDGNPGKIYWQNHSEYKIKVEIEPATRKLSGIEQIEYFNNSPDTLNQIVIRLYQDIFKKGNIRNWPLDAKDINDGVNLDFITVELDTVDFNNDTVFTRNGTNCFIQLPDGVPPQTKINLEIKWDFVIDNNTKMRMGAYDESSFFVAYWYPQIAVYDDIDGWDIFNYSAITECYNDYCEFDVEITLPNDFIVWATGELKNPEELLSEKYLDRYIKSNSSNSIIHIIDSTDLDLKAFTKTELKLTWKFIANSIPDFSFALSDHYLWDAASYQADLDSDERVLINAAYRKDSKDFYHVADISINTIKYLSNELPGVPYPFPTMSVFNGGGGMEFPMMVNDASCASVGEATYLTSHEITHSYFPFFVGINERKYAWMDESMAVMLPMDFQLKNVPDVDRIAKYTKHYSENAGLEMEIPSIIPSQIIDYDVYKISYRISAYRRPAIAHLILRDILGKELFKKAIQEFISRWNGKHPIPYDFFFTFNDIVGEDLSWYWKPWFFDFAYPDLSISSVKEDADGLEVKIKNLGKLPVPIHLQIVNEDSVVDTVYHNARVWQKGNQEAAVKIKYDKPVNTITLGTTHIPDVNNDNNVWNRSK